MSAPEPRGEPPLSTFEKIAIVVMVLIMLVMYGGPIAAEFVGAYWP